MSEDRIDLLEYIENGHVFVKEQSGYSVRTPDGRHGFGPTPADALLNVDAQILPSPPAGHPLHGAYSGRLLVRADGTSVKLDALGEKE